MNLSGFAASAATDAVCSLLNGGFLRIYNAAHVLLAELRFQQKAFYPAIDGLAKSRTPDPETNAPCSGMASTFYACDPSGAPVFSGTIGVHDYDDMKMDDAYITAGAKVQTDGITYSFIATLAADER